MNEKQRNTFTGYAPAQGGQDDTFRCPVLPDQQSETQIDSIWRRRM